MRKIINTDKELIKVLKNEGVDLGKGIIDDWLELDDRDKKEYPLDLLPADNSSDLDYIKEAYGYEIEEFNPSLTDKKVTVEAKESIWNDYLEIYIDAANEVIKKYIAKTISKKVMKELSKHKNKNSEAYECLSENIAWEFTEKYIKENNLNWNISETFDKVFDAIYEIEKAIKKPMAEVSYEETPHTPKEIMEMEK